MVRTTLGLAGLLVLAAAGAVAADQHYPDCIVNPVGSTNKSIPLVKSCVGWINAGYTDLDGNCDQICNTQGVSCVCVDLVQGNWCNMYTACGPNTTSATELP